MICGRKHAMSAHNDCWKKWKQHNIGVLTTDVPCFINSCNGNIKKIGGTRKKLKPTTLIFHFEHLLKAHHIK